MTSDYSMSGRIAFINGDGTNSMLMAVRADGQEAMIEVGGQRFYVSDRGTVTTIQTGLSRMKTRLRRE